MSLCTSLLLLILEYSGQIWQLEKCIPDEHVLLLGSHGILKELVTVGVATGTVVVLWDVQQVGANVSKQSVTGFYGYFPECHTVKVVLFDVLTAPEADGLQGTLPAFHHGSITILVLGVWRDDDEKPIEH